MSEENNQENKVFLVRVQEYLVADVYVEAATLEEALEKVEEKYYNQELVLDAENYEDTEYMFPEEYESITKFREQFAGETVHLINENNELVLTDIKPVGPVIEEKAQELNNLKPNLEVTVKSIQQNNIQELTDAGRWDIYMDVYKRIVNGAVFDDVYLGSVAYGNVLYNIHICQDDTGSGKYYVELNKSYPADGTGNLEQKHFFFDTNDYMQLQIDYVTTEDDNCAFVELDDHIMYDFETFKRAVVVALYKQAEIFPAFSSDYMVMKRSGLNFYDQFKTKMNYLENLAELRSDELPRDVIYEHVSSAENLDILGAYYQKALPLIFDDNATLQDNNKLLVKEMIDNGLDNIDIVNFSNRLGPKNYHYIVKSLTEPDIIEYRRQIINNICLSKKIFPRDINRLGVNYHSMFQGDDYIVRDMIKRGLPDNTIKDVFKVIDNIMNSDFNRSSYVAELLKSSDMKQLRKEYAINHNFEDLGR